MTDKVPKGWKRVKLGEVVEFNYGKSLPERKRISGDIPVYSSAGITGWHNQPLIDSNGIIIGRKGTIGKVYKSNVPFYPIDTCYYVLPNDKKYNFDFLYYLLVSLKLDELNEDSAVPGLNRNTAYSQEILLPPFPEQKAIASVLSSLDDKIDLLHRQNKTLEKMAETLFRQWFVEEAKEDWEEVKLGEVVNIRYGKNLPTSNLIEKGYPVFGGNGLIGYYKEYLYGTPQVLIACRGAASGKVLISLPYSFVTNNSLILEIPQKSILTFEFLKYYAYSTDFSSYISGSAQPQITINDLRNAEMLLPPKNKIINFSEIIRPVERKMLYNQQQIRTLEKLRDTLLPKLMSGQIRVKI